jgi:ABC-type branched-subunit amino acid transport system substrate-binding protein
MPGQEDSRGPQGQANATPPDAPGSGEIRIGLLVPINKPIPPPGGGSPWPRGLVGRAGIERAIAEENAREERAGRSPLVLSVATSTFSGYGWGRSEDSFGVLPVEFGVRALVGWIGRDDLVQTLLAARLGLPIVNSAPELPTPDESASAWIFRCGSNDPRRHRALLDHVFDTVGATRLAIVRTPGSRKHLDWWSEYALERGHPVVAQIDWDPGAPDPGTAVELIRRSRAQVVLTWAGASDSAKLLRAMRKAGLDQLFVGSEAIGSSEFLEGMDAAAGRVLCFERCPHHAASAVRGGSPPGQAAAEAPGIAGEDFEAGEHLVEAIRRGGPEPERIRDELRRMSSVTLLELKDGAWNRRPARSIFR